MVGNNTETGSPWQFRCFVLYHSHWFLFSCRLRFSPSRLCDCAFVLLVQLIMRYMKVSDH